MARKSKLKVYRTPIGFHDAFVAATSQKAALAAWGSDADLFARGIAEVVADEELAREPLANPGKVIRRLRGTTEEQLAALPKIEAKPKGAAEKPATENRAPPSPKKPPPPKPKPDRAPVDEARRAIEEAYARYEDARARLAARQAELEEERRSLERQRERELADLQRKFDRAQQTYDRAMDKWRG